jgi:hypothetical protein
LKSVDFIKSIFQETQTFVITPIFGKSKFLKFWFGVDSPGVELDI